MTVVRYDTAVSQCLTQGEPLHLPGSVSFAAVKLWRWTDDLKRVCSLAGGAHVQVWRHECDCGLILQLKPCPDFTNVVVGQGRVLQMELPAAM